MLKKTILSVINILMSTLFVCAEVSIDFNSGLNNIQEELVQAQADLPVPVPQAIENDKGLFDWLFKPKVKEWTIMVYINAKNDLERFGLKDVNEMEMVGSSDKVNIVVELGRMSGYDSSDGDWTGTRRYFIQKDTDTSKITSPVVEDLGKTDMGAWQSVASFGKWAKAKYPAKKYMFVIWNHGTGWYKNLKSLITKGISYDDETGTNLTTPQMAMALKYMGGVNVYGSDACLMGMAEIVYEIKDYANFIIGSEEVEPADGYPYNAFLSALIKTPTMTPEQLAKVVVDTYADYYQSINKGSTQAYVRSAKINKFLQLLNDWTYTVSNSNEKDIVKSARSKAQSYVDSNNRDLYHFVSLVVQNTKNTKVSEKGKTLMKFIKNELVGHNRYTNGSGGWWWGPSDYSNSHGIAIYLPGYSFNTDYNELAWAKYSNWDEFINWYQAKE